MVRTRANIVWRFGIKKPPLFSTINLEFIITSSPRSVFKTRRLCLSVSGRSSIFPISLYIVNRAHGGNADLDATASILQAFPRWNVENDDDSVVKERLLTILYLGCYGRGWNAGAWER